MEEQKTLQQLRKPTKAGFIIPHVVKNDEVEPMMTKYQKEYKKGLEEAKENKEDCLLHEYGFSETFTISSGTYREITIETEKPIGKNCLIFISIVSDDGSHVLGGIGEYLLPYKHDELQFKVIVENHSETRKCRVNYHKVSQK